MSAIAMATCYCVGPPGNCPCIRRARGDDLEHANATWLRPFWDQLAELNKAALEPKRDPMKAMG